MPPADHSDHLDDLYRQAASLEDALPDEATRMAILTEARRAAPRSAAFEADVRQASSRAANAPRWRLAAAGSAAVLVFAALLVVPRLWEPPRVLRPGAAASRRATEPATEALANVASDDAAPLAELSQPAAATSLATRGARRAAHDRSPAAPQPSPTSPAANAKVAQGAMPPRANPTASAAADETAPREARQNSAVALPALIAAGDVSGAAQLLNAGADVQQQDASGHSVLMLAVMQGREDLVQLLLAHGADPGLPDATGQSPLGWARQHAAARMQALLRTAPR